MELTDHSLRQMDEDDIRKLPEEAVRELAVRLLKDLKEAHGNYSDPLTLYPLPAGEGAAEPLAACCFFPLKTTDWSRGSE